MTIKRSDVDRGRVDFSDVTSGRRLPPVHPGEILRDEFLVPLELSVYRLAQILKVSRPRLNDIVHGRRAVTTDTALRLGYYFGTPPEFWLNLQTRYDLDVAAHTLRRKIERKVTPRAAEPGAWISAFVGMTEETHRLYGIVNFSSTQCAPPFPATPERPLTPARAAIAGRGFGARPTAVVIPGKKLCRRSQYLLRLQ